MDKFSKQDANTQKSRIDYINQRWKQLNLLEKEWGERALQYLLMTNSGGAIATLSFLGASKIDLAEDSGKFALLFFIVGIILAGISTAKTYHSMSGLYKSWMKDANLYFEDEKTWKELISKDENLSKAGFFDYAIPYSSFFCFGAGCIAGAFALFQL